MNNKSDKKDILNRISYVEGHYGAIKRMVDEGVYCIDVIHQIEAIESALRKIKERILENHLDTCVTTAIKGNNEKQRAKVLGELMEIFKKNNHDR